MEIDVDLSERAREISPYLSLGTRQIQIGMLSDLGYSAEEQVEIIKQQLEASLETNTVTSTKSNIKRQALYGALSYNFIFNGRTEITPPETHPDEPDTEETTVHLYSGNIGCGGTTTAQSHALRIADDVDQMYIVDPVGEDGWETVAEEIPHATQYVPEQVTQQWVEELADEIRKTDDNEVTAVFFDSAHYLTENARGALWDLYELPQPLSLRLVSVKPYRMPDEITVEMCHLHRITHENEIDEIIARIGDTHPFNPGMHDVLPSLPIANSRQDVPAPHVLTLDTTTQAQTVRPNILSERERELLV